MKKIAVNKKTFTPEQRTKEIKKQNRKNKSFDELTDYVELLEQRLETLENIIKNKTV